MSCAGELGKISVGRSRWWSAAWWRSGVLAWGGGRCGERAGRLAGPDRGVRVQSGRWWSNGCPRPAAEDLAGAGLRPGLHRELPGWPGTAPGCRCAWRRMHGCPARPLGRREESRWARRDRVRTRC